MIWFYSALESLRDFMDLGGGVLWAIMFALFLMWTLILERVWFIFKVHPANVRQILRIWNKRKDTSSWYARRIRDALISESSIALRRNIGVIRALIAVCPLLGLLGTVTGMIAVFDAMSYAAGANARAIAGGVSMATIPTMAGMVAALSGLYLGTWLDHRVSTEVERLEDQLQHNTV